jgi:3-deoxy-D-manno-octulosonate 8-phosphate phosphatase (KDO 8-P phosphatase)
MEEIEKLYSELGGKFITPFSEIKNKLQGIKAFVFDWDGVFNNGQKDTNRSSNFSEVDSMGTNLLRYSYYLRNRQIPLTVVISGEKNETAFYFCKRENFNSSIFKVPDKMPALNFICENENIKPSEIAYFFDDVLDLPIAEVCGVRILINQKINPLFIDYCLKNKMADYISSVSGGNHAVREVTELLIGLYGNYDDVISNRKNYSRDYKGYLEKRKQIVTKYYTLVENSIAEAVTT